MIGKLSAVATGLMVIGAVGLMTQIGHGNVLAKLTDQSQIDQTRTIDAGGTKNIKFDVGSGVLHVTPSTDHSVKVHVYGTASQSYLDQLRWGLQNSGDWTKMTFKRDRQWGLDLQWMLPEYVKVNIDVTVPQKTYDQLVVQSGTGDVHLQNLDAAQLHVDEEPATSIFNMSMQPYT